MEKQWSLPLWGLQANQEQRISVKTKAEDVVSKPPSTKTDL